MRYPCIGSPACLKTFENGYVLRAHQLSCEHALIKLNYNIRRQENIRNIQYNYVIKGIKGNKPYPTYTGLDQTQKFLIRDRYQLGGNNNTEQFYRRIRQPPDSKNIIIQTKSTAMDFSGYYT